MEGRMMKYFLGLMKIGLQQKLHPLQLLKQKNGMVGEHR